MRGGGSVAYAQRVARLKPALKLLAIALVSTVVIVLVAVIGATVTVRRSLPDRSGELSISGLTQEVKVYRDEQGIPQIFAQNDSDLMRAQGYVHAQDRFFEMDLRRHVTAGRLAELVGDDEDAVASDRVVRTLGWRRVAEAEFPQLASETRNLLQAYADGVNAYTKGRSSAELAVEYALLDLRLPSYRVEAWTPVDSLAWLKAMAWDLKANYDDELTRARLSATTPVRRIEQLYPKFRPSDNAPILDTAELAAGSKSTEESQKSATTEPTSIAGGQAEVAPVLKSESGKRSLAAAQAALRVIPELVGKGAGVGSNSWVLSGKHTASGKPLLANDPHLEPSLPGIWYQIGLHCISTTPKCTFGVSGFSFAGLPGVVIGHNDRVSWGLTNLGADVTDLFLERIVGGRVEYDGEYGDLEQRTETVKVRGGRERPLLIRSTRHGPLISDVSESAQDAGRDVSGDRTADLTYDAALSWTALTPGRAAEGLFAINRATNWKTFRSGAKLFGEPSQNMIYADVDGNIGYQAPGRIPIRSGFDGRWPVPGWSSKYSWKGYVPFEDLPAVLNPEDGVIITANQAVSSSTMPFLTQDWEPGYRAQRIADELVESRGVTVSQAQKLQLDSKNPSARFLVPVLRQIDLSEAPFSQEAQALLRDWDFSQPADSAPAAYYNAVWRNVLSLAFDDELGRELAADGGERWVAVVADLLARPDDPWWDNKATPGVIESRDEVLRQSLIAARVDLTRALGKDVSRWRWGNLHRLQLENPVFGTAAAPWPIRSMMNRGPFALGGGPGSVNATFWSAGAGYAVDELPSMRMVIDLADFDQSTWINLTGVSGHPYDKHFMDQFDYWLTGRSYRWPHSLGAIKDSAAAEQKMRPDPRQSSSIP